MNKRTILIVSVLASLVCDTAFGFVRIGWDRPIFKSDLTVTNQQGVSPINLAGSKSVELVMTQQDGASVPTGFVLLIDGQFQQAYEVKSSSTDSCKQTTYALVPVQSGNNYVLKAVFESIQVVDHSIETCSDTSKFGWEMEVKTVNLLHEVTGEIQLAGNPESIITPQ